MLFSFSFPKVGQMKHVFSEMAKAPPLYVSSLLINGLPLTISNESTEFIFRHDFAQLSAFPVIKHRELSFSTQDKLSSQQSEDCEHALRRAVREQHRRRHRAGIA